MKVQLIRRFASDQMNVSPQAVTDDEQMLPYQQHVHVQKLIRMHVVQHDFIRYPQKKNISTPKSISIFESEGNVQQPPNNTLIKYVVTVFVIILFLNDSDFLLTLIFCS